jgi:hypothetical protein
VGRLVLISLLAAVLVLGVGQAGATPVTFSDPAGDAGNAPDLTSTVVDNDAGGKISMVISWANAAYLNEDSFISVYFNSDRNAATGNAGSDYLLRIRGSDYTYEYLRWNGSDWVDPPSPITVTVDQNVLQTFEVTMYRPDLGGSTAFDFYLVGEQRGGSVVLARDSAPDSGVWTYRLAGFAPPPTTTTTPTPPPAPPPAPKPTPKVPPTVGLGAVAVKTAGGVHAGRIFTVAGRVTTDARSVRVSCVIKVSGRAVPALAHYAAHLAICQGIAPAGSVGKRLAGVMTVTIRGDRDARAFSFVIHR